MNLVCVGEVTVEHDIRLDENARYKLFPGERIRVRIESMEEKTELKRLAAIERLKKISRKSKLGLYGRIICREDAHDRGISLDS